MGSSVGGRCLRYSFLLHILGVRCLTLLQLLCCDADVRLACFVLVFSCAFSFSPAVQMYHEGGGMWSVVTPVPAGTHEFKFVVDGEWKHSTRHPTVGDDEETMNNVRVIRGPPKQSAQTNAASPRPGAGDSRAPTPLPEQKSGCCIIS